MPPLLSQVQQMTVATIAAQMATAEYSRSGVPPWKSPGWEKPYIERAAVLVRAAGAVE